jgi:hypothetical protein
MTAYGGETLPGRRRISICHTHSKRTCSDQDTETTMSKKTLVYVIYPGVSLLELVGNRTVLGGIMERKAGYRAVVAESQVRWMA